MLNIVNVLIYVLNWIVMYYCTRENLKNKDINTDINTVP